jgi:hypothetical protein
MVSLPSNLPLSYYDYIFSEFGDDDKMYKCGYFVTTRSKFPLKLSTPQIFFPRSWNNYAYVCNDAYYMFWKNFEINKFYRTNILDYCVGTGILFSDFGYSGNFEYYTSSNNFVSTPVVFTRSDNYNSFNISYLYKVSLPKYPYFYDNHTFLFEILFFSFILIFFYLYISYIFICLYILKCLFRYIDENIFEFDEN